MSVEVTATCTLSYNAKTDDICGYEITVRAPSPDTAMQIAKEAIRKHHYENKMSHRPENTELTVTEVDE